MVLTTAALQAGRMRADHMLAGPTAVVVLAAGQHTAVRRVVGVGSLHTEAVVGTVHTHQNQQGVALACRCLQMRRVSMQVMFSPSRSCGIWLLVRQWH